MTGIHNCLLALLGTLLICFWLLWFWNVPHIFRTRCRLNNNHTFTSFFFYSITQTHVHSNDFPNKIQWYNVSMKNWLPMPIEKNSVLNTNDTKIEEKRKKMNKRNTCHRQCIIRRDIHLPVSCCTAVVIASLKVVSGYDEFNINEWLRKKLLRLRRYKIISTVWHKEFTIQVHYYLNWFPFFSFSINKNKSKIYWLNGVPYEFSLAEHELAININKRGNKYRFKDNISAKNSNLNISIS